MKDSRTLEQKNGQDGTCPTVIVKGAKGGTMIINAHDYNEETHGKILKAQDAAPPAEKEAPNVEPVDWTKRTVADMKDYLADKGVAFDTSARKDDLIALCVANP